MYMHSFVLTVGDRLKGRESLYGFCHQLNVYGNTPFAELSGAFPASSLDALDTRVHRFTIDRPKRKGGVCSYVLRHFSGCGTAQICSPSIPGRPLATQCHARLDGPCKAPTGRLWR